MEQHKPAVSNITYRELYICISAPSAGERSTSGPLGSEAWRLARARHRFLL